MPGEPVKAHSVRWSGMSYGKFCTSPEVVAFKMNWPGEKEWSFDYEMYQGKAPGLELGHGFMNVHYMHGKPGVMDYLYNDSDSGLNFMLKMNAPTKGGDAGQKLLTQPQLNIERRLCGTPFGFLIGGPKEALDLTNLAAGVPALEFGARAMEQTPLGQAAVQLDWGLGLAAAAKPKTPSLGLVLDAGKVVKGLKLGAQTTYNGGAEELQFRGLWKGGGFSSCVQYIAWAKGKDGKEGKKNNVVATVRTPTVDVGVPVTCNVQVKASPSDSVQLATAVVEADLGSGSTAKVKVEKDPSKAGTPKLAASLVFTGTGGHQIALGVGVADGKEPKFGLQVWKGYYNFCQW